MKLRALLGRIRRRMFSPAPAASAAETQAWSRLAAKCCAAPADPEPHLGLARHFFALGRLLPSHACYRTALALGSARDAALDASAAQLSQARFADGRTAPLIVTQLEFQRLARIAIQVRQRLAGRPGTLLDVGGGQGALALHLPEVDYFLAEPAINGLTSADAAGFGRQFDVVTCCHVLEHIPESAKPAFVANLVARAKNHVILLGPSIEATPPPAVDEIFFRRTGESWAREHLECGYPRIADLRKFAAQRGLRCTVTPNGDLAMMYWMVFAYHYAAQAGRAHELPELAAHFNREICPDPPRPLVPNDYLVEMEINPPPATQ